MVAVVLGWHQSIPNTNPRRSTDDVLGTLRNEILLYSAVHGERPPKQGWCEAVHAGTCPYPNDAWGHRYQFLHKGGEFDFELRSAGADGKLGTRDDLVRVFSMEEEPGETSTR